MPFQKGQSGNPAGRPRGVLSITDAIKRELEKMPEGEDKTYLQLLVKRILKKGIVDGDVQTIKQIWNYVDGMPKQDFGFPDGLKITFDKTFDASSTTQETTGDSSEQGEVQSN